MSFGVAGSWNAQQGTLAKTDPVLKQLGLIKLPSRVALLQNYGPFEAVMIFPKPEKHTLLIESLGSNPVSLGCGVC